MEFKDTVEIGDIVRVKRNIDLPELEGLQGKVTYLQKLSDEETILHVNGDWVGELLFDSNELEFVE